MTTAVALACNGLFISQGWFLFFSAAITILIFFLTGDNEVLRNRIHDMKTQIDMLENSITERRLNYIIPADFVKTSAMSVYNTSFTPQYYDIINNYRVTEHPQFPGHYTFAKKNGWILKWNNFNWIMTEFNIDRKSVPQSWKCL
jgi:hypothetical protein